MTLEDKLISLFKYFIFQISGNQDFSFRFQKRELVSITNFSNFLNERYGEGNLGSNFLYRYFVFQFEYWRTKDTRAGSGLAKVTWILGKKAFERWLNKIDDYWYFCECGVLKENDNIKYKDVEKILKVEPVKVNCVKVKKSEEVEKLRHYDKLEGLVHCISSTTLFNHKSKLCMRCKNRKNCKELLRVNYYEVYKKRGYNV